MTAWLWIALGCFVAYATKLAGYLLPDSALDAPMLRQASGSVTVGLLSALVVANTFGAGQALVLDARVAALAAAALALTLRLPFIVVVVIGAAAAAVARLAGAA